ncbi:MAG: tetratricopeptide repeat protein [Bacteroidota bacterium]
MSDKLFCSHCGASVQPSDKFCASCGRKREETHGTPIPEQPERSVSAAVVCPSCGVQNAAGSERCFSCGSILTPAAIPAAAPRRAPASADEPKGKGKKKMSLTMQLVIAFSALVIFIIVIESQNAPTAVSPQSQQQSTVQPAAPDKDILQTIMLLENAVKADSSNTEAILQLANALHDARMFPRAIESYKAYIRRMPKKTDAMVDLGICYFETGDIETAVKEIKKALAVDPGHQMAMFNLGVILLSDNKTEESKRWLQKAIDIDPNSPAGERAKEILHQH